MDVLKTELAYFNKIKSKFVVEFSQEDFNYIEQVETGGWELRGVKATVAGLEGQAGEDQVWRPGLGSLHRNQVTSQHCSTLNTQQAQINWIINFSNYSK